LSRQKRPLFGAIDLGGTKLLSVIATPDGEILARDRRPSQTQEGLEAILARMAGSLDSAAEEAGVQPSQLGAVGVASAGAINFDRGIVSEAPQLPGWQDVPLRDLLQEQLQLPVLLDNDANAAGFGELTFGAGRGSRHLIYLTISTGIGGGIIIDGQLYRGKSGAAAELGHIVIDMGGPVCPCGARGCLEAIASGTAMVWRAQEALEQGRSPLLAQLAAEEPLTAELIARAARQGDEACTEIYRVAAFALGNALASYVSIFDPNAIVLGGGIMNSSELIFEPARRTMEGMVRRLPLQGLRVLKGELGDESGVLGMVALLRRDRTFGG